MGTGRVCGWRKTDRRSATIAHTQSRDDGAPRDLWGTRILLERRRVSVSWWLAKVLEMDSLKPRARRRVRTAASFAAVGW